MKQEKERGNWKNFLDENSHLLWLFFFSFFLGLYTAMLLIAVENWEQIHKGMFGANTILLGGLTLLFYFMTTTEFRAHYNKLRG